MGIKDINKNVREHAPAAFIEVPLAALKEKRIAVDGNGWLYARVSTANKEIITRMPDPLEPVDRNAVLSKVRQALVDFNYSFFIYGVTVVWVWDGEGRPEKKECHAERKEDSDKNKKKANDARLVLEAIHPMMRTSNDLLNYKKALWQVNWVDRSEVQEFRHIAESYGFPSLQAPFDAEKLCASLAQEGLVVGVWSVDTDNYALGTPMMITGWGTKHKEHGPMLEVVILPYILQAMKMTQSTFVDFCIMHGCDFGKRIRLVGPVKIWNLFQKYNCIETMMTAEPNKDYPSLRYEICRRLFAYEKSGYTINSPEINVDKGRFSQQARDVSASYGLMDAFTKIIPAIKSLPTPVVTPPPPPKSRFTTASSSSTPPAETKSVSRFVTAPSLPEKVEG